jgi:hypothetical protein
MSYKSWTEKERRILKNYYYLLSPEDMQRKLPGRTRSQMYNQVCYLKKRGWWFNANK